MVKSETQIKQSVTRLLKCRRCPDVFPPVVTGLPILSKIILVGQAPGIHEGDAGKPFAWTAGKTLFKWFASIGLTENEFRTRVYMAAVCRCFPGKNINGGDRLPTPTEIKNCKNWLDRELKILQPELIIPVGKLAITQFLDFKKLKEVVGSIYEVSQCAGSFDVIPLPHPSGASTWHRTHPGKQLLNEALQHIEEHPAFSAVKEPF